MSTRDELLAWAKKRALAELPDAGAVMSSLIQDFSAHPETEGSADDVRELMFPLAMTGEFQKPGKLKKFIEDFE